MLVITEHLQAVSPSSVTKQCHQTVSPNSVTKMRDMSSVQEEPCREHRISSSDVLFPEEQTWEMYEGDNLLPPPQAPFFKSSCTLYTNELGYIIDPQYEHLRENGDILDLLPSFQTNDNIDDVKETLYAVPLTGNCPAKLRRACINTFVNPDWRKHFAERRKTWSPPTFERVMASAGGNFLSMRSCHSNDQLAVDSGNSDDPDAKAPPKIAPVSGILNNNTHVIKPIAFRPTVTHQSQPMTQQHISGHMTRHVSDHMTQRHVNEHMTQRQVNKHMTQRHVNGHMMQLQSTPQYSPVPFCQRSPCLSQTSPELSSASRRLSHTSSQPSPHPLHRLTQPSPNLSQMSPHTLTHLTVYQPASPHQPMSPRQPTMMRSANQSQDDGYMSQEYHMENHNHSGSNHSHNTSQGSLQHESYTSRCRANCRSDSLTSSNLSAVSSSPSDSGVGELEGMLRVKDAMIEQLRETMERNETAIIETYTQKQQNWQMHIQQVHAEWQRRLRAEQRRSYEMEQSLLQQMFQLRKQLSRNGEWDGSLQHHKVSPKSDTSSGQTDGWVDRVTEQLHAVTEMYEKTKHELEVTQRQLDWVRQDATSRKSGVAGGGEMVKRGLLAAAQAEVTRLEKALATEREQWLDEKNKVVRYQKHLQLNYVQMYRKNKMLEAEVEQLTLELENRHIVDATAIAATVDNDKLMVTNLAASVDESSC